MSEEITAEQLVQKVREQAQAHPDKVYKKDPDVDSATACVYAHSTEPGCIIGWALHDLGWSLEDLRMLDEGEDTGIVDVIRAGEIPGIDQIDDEVEWLREVQDYQDRRDSWSEAVTLADRHRA